MNKAITPKCSTLTLVTPGTPVRASTVTVRTPYMECYAPSGNSGSVYFGTSLVDDGWIPIDPGEKITLNASVVSGDGDYFDLSNFYMDGETADNLLIIQYWS